MPAVPRYRPIERYTGRIAYCDWAQEGLHDTILDLVLKIAVWLGLTRNAQAVMTFCDVVRAFSLKQPSATTDAHRISLLYSLTTLRISSDGVRSGIATPESDDWDRSPFSDNNPRYLVDVNNQFNLDFHGVRAIAEQNLPQLELDDFFHISGNGPDRLTSVSNTYQWDHPTPLRGRTQVGLRRQVLNDLLQGSIGTTLSSKPILKKTEVSPQCCIIVHMLTGYIPKQISEEEPAVPAVPAEDADGEEHPSSTPASQPVPTPQRRGFSIFGFGGY